VLGPDGPNAFRKYWQENDLPFTGAADIRSKIADTYHQEVSLFKLGRMPAVFVIDPQGRIRFYHYGEKMSDIPLNQQLLDVLEGIQTEKPASTS